MQKYSGKVFAKSIGKVNFPCMGSSFFDYY